MSMNLTLGPIPFHWDNDTKLDFYTRIADEAPVDTVYLGEVICSKRSPFFDPHLEEVAERLEAAGKKVVFSSLTEVVLKRERKMAAAHCDIEDREIEINTSSALLDINARRHRIGPMMNVYNEVTMAYLASKGATHFVLPVELPGSSVSIMAAKAQELGVGSEVQVFGRASVAVSARCYHARAHGRIKDNCQFICEQDPDGMQLKTLDNQEFLAINGIQTLSHSYVNLIAELDSLRSYGVTDCRLVPHSQDMVSIAQTFRDVLDGKETPDEGFSKLGNLGIPAPFSNGFWHGVPGHRYVANAA